MIAIGCALLSAVSFYFSLGLGTQWWLAWLAPIPVLWLAFGETKSWQVFLASWAAMALGCSSVLRAYGGSLPAFVLVLIIGIPSLLFAASVMGARLVRRERAGRRAAQRGERCADGAVRARRPAYIE